MNHDPSSPHSSCFSARQGGLPSPSPGHGDGLDRDSAFTGSQPRKNPAAKASASGNRRFKRSSGDNQAALEALNRARNPAERVALRNQLVHANLPLVYAITGRMGGTLGLPHEDLRQIGSLGLLRAIEAFQPSRGRSLSSFAVPYIRGAIQHELRDRCSLMRIPRPLWELRRRATVLQDRRRRLGQSQLAPARLAESLGCPITQLVEALHVGAVVEMRSLDAPVARKAGERGGAQTLVDLVADPATLTWARLEPPGPWDDEPMAGPTRGQGGDDGSGKAQPQADRSSTDATEESPRRGSWRHGNRQPQGAGDGAATAGSNSPGPSDDGRPGTPPAIPPELSWLQRRLAGLTVLERELVLGHVCCGRSWAELARELGLHPRQAQRRTVALLRRLQEEGQRWRQAGGSSQGCA